MGRKSSSASGRGAATETFFFSAGATQPASSKVKSPPARKQIMRSLWRLVSLPLSLTAQSRYCWTRVRSFMVEPS